MAQNTVFHQIVKLIPRTLFQSWVKKYNGDKGTRTLDSWTWFGALLFGQISRHDSIRALERVFCQGDRFIQKLGFRSVCRSTLADANKSRPTAILDEVFSYALNRAQTVIPRANGFRFHGDVLALDSTTIQLCLALCPWAKFRRNKGATKLHTAIDLAGDLPKFAIMTDGKMHDVKAAKHFLHFDPGTTVVFDRAYVDYLFLNDLDENGVFFVTRMKTNCQFRIIECRETNRTRGHICDQIIRLKSQRGECYKGLLRRISYNDPDTGKRLVFLTNRFDLATQTICDLYKARWKVELFFRTMKQHLKIKRFLGTSVNAVKAQILTALIAYLLVQVIRYSMKVKISMPETMAVLATMLLLKQPLTRLLGDIPRVTRYPPDRQALLPF
jgi:hypothetical protein